MRIEQIKAAVGQQCHINGAGDRFMDSRLPIYQTEKSLTIEKVTRSGMVLCTDGKQEFLLPPKNIEEILTGESYTQKDVERVVTSLAMKNVNLKTRVIDGVEYYEDEGIRWPKKDFDEAVANASKKLKDAIDKMCAEDTK